MSADGSVIVGSYTDASAREVRGFRWTAAGGLENLHSLGGTYNGATAVSADGKVIAGYRRDSMTTRAVRWTLQTVPEVNTYTINLQTALLNRILWKVQLGRGITGPSSPGNVAVYGERRINGVIRSGNHAKAINVWGGKRLAIIKAGTATPNPSGGPLRLRFYPGFSDGHVKVKELKVFNIISDDATLTLLRRNQVVRHINLPRTGSGMGATIRLNEPNVTTIRIDAPHAFAIDGIVFENERE